MLTIATFSVCFAVGCLLAMLRHPIFGLITYVAVFYLNPPDRWWGSALPGLRWSLIAAIVTLVGVLIHQPSAGAKPFLSNKLLWGLVAFLAWLLIQSAWALAPEEHLRLIILTGKYLLLLFLIYKCIESVSHLKYFLWVHVAGCFYLSMLVFTSYEGGRFEEFGGPGIGEANSGALQVVTGIIVCVSLFLVGRLREKLAATAVMPFIVNSLVSTISRSGFLAFMVGGILFNCFSPRKLHHTVRVLSMLGLLLLAMLTNVQYWERIETILLAGEEVEGVDTGAGRLVLIEAQFQMFQQYPLGCGHRCTATLSRLYLAEEHLTEQDARSSHNTFMSLLVEQGIPGVVLYILYLFWVAKWVLKLRRPMLQGDGLLPITYTATVAIIGAITIGDMFVDYLKFEARYWFLGILLVLIKLSEKTGLEKDDRFRNGAEVSVGGQVLKRRIGRVADS